MKHIKEIADLLPDGLSETVLDKIAELVSETINEEVQSRVKSLEAKVLGFLRTSIDEVKEHALFELEQESETFRNAAHMAQIKSMLALDLGGNDYDAAVQASVTEANQVQEENQVLVEELGNSVSLVTKLEATVNALKEQVTQLTADKDQLASENEALTEQSRLLDEDGYVTSERAVVPQLADKVTQTKDAVNERSAGGKVNNPHLTQEVLDTNRRLNG